MTDMQCSCLFSSQIQMIPVETVHLLSHIPVSPAVPTRLGGKKKQKQKKTYSCGLLLGRK